MGEKVTLDKIADKSVFEQKYRYKNKIGDRADSKIRQRKYVVESLCRDFSDKKATALALRIMNCSASQKCNQPFCPMCRHKKQELFAKYVIDKFGSVSADKLRLLTILHSVHYNPLDINSDLIKKLRKDMDNLFDKIQDCADDNIRFIGAFEIDAIAGDEELSDRKVNTLSALGYDKDAKNACFLLHFHAVMYIPSFQNPKYDIEREIRKYYNGSHQVDFTDLHKDKTHDENLHNMATYMLKFRLQHSKSVASDDDEKQFTRTQYSSLYSYPIAKSVVMAVDRCGGFQGLITRRLK
ncbi:conserved protein of unknown function [Magnetospirillum gryphiswaldense MSR-1 v2]|uniref:Replication protein n=1 Tax=Magnetospirillum gryphiswaldense (strain DSM 6361 / JCM 21280 / NBRC 15271 / MSR-1) TaxID=431944 RepID=V6EZB8_MAGGM|nr:hypothetical protein [Magnetospirillum gryphiswaldense]CDK98502.1 conserved protein of unknown function [Magnetospirillum gryphiswaldense MSR-1 v2]